MLHYHALYYVDNKPNLKKNKRLWKIKTPQMPLLDWMATSFTENSKNRRKVVRIF